MSEKVSSKPAFLSAVPPLFSTIHEHFTGLTPNAEVSYVAWSSIAYLAGLPSSTIDSICWQ